MLFRAVTNGLGLFVSQSYLEQSDTYYQKFLLYDTKVTSSHVICMYQSMLRQLYGLSYDTEVLSSHYICVYQAVLQHLYGLLYDTEVLLLP